MAFYEILDRGNDYQYNDKYNKGYYERLGYLGEEILGDAF